MKLKPNDILRWEGGDGILKNGQEYLVRQTRDGYRAWEFILKYKDWQMVEPIVWWEEGEPFVRVEG